MASGTTRSIPTRNLTCSIYFVSAPYALTPALAMLLLLTTVVIAPTLGGPLAARRLATLRVQRRLDLRPDDN